MKAIVCEMCGSQDFVKKNGMYVCQNCRTKYDPDEAKKLMVEVSAEKKEKRKKGSRKKPLKNSIIAAVGIVLLAIVIILIAVSRNTQTTSFISTKKSPFDKLTDCPDSITTQKLLGVPSEKERRSSSYPSTDYLFRYYDYEYLGYKGELLVWFYNQELVDADWVCETADVENAFAEITRTMNRKFDGTEDEQYHKEVIIIDAIGGFSSSSSISSSNVWFDEEGNVYELYIDLEDGEIWMVFTPYREKDDPTVFFDFDFSPASNYPDPEPYIVAPMPEPTPEPAPEQPVPIPYPQW